MSAGRRSASRWSLRRSDAAVLALDLKSASRDGVLLATALLSAFLVIALAAAGAAEASLGLQSWRPWIPAALGAVLASAPGGPAFLFAAILIEEKETRVGGALAATPTPRARLATLRIGALLSYVAVFLALSVAAVAAAWPALFPAAPGAEAAARLLLTLGLIILSLALLSGAVCLTLRRLAANRVEALAAFKALNVALALPIALPLAAPLGLGEAWWRPLAQAMPTGPALESLSRLAAGEAEAALLWSFGALAYAAALQGAAVLSARRS